ncbi:MAG: 16S rRNA (guanine(527)-N(7))-methyltransferase RsmG [Actinobacteria bacterium]|nr:16S rRNA (guanine(527)-N(7))-methyltransferase RsmG [Actinomycetota bacterium]
MKQRIGDAAGKLGLELDASQIDKLLRFHELLRGRGLEIGAIARSDRDRVLDRHILDSLRGAVAIHEGDRIAYDFGSGAGLPGVPLAIARPACGWILVESRHWRAAFLELAVSELELNARVERARVETMGVLADVITARAFAPLAKAWDIAAPLLKPPGRLIFFAGAGLEDPEGAARAAAGDGVVVEVLPDLLDRGGPLVIMSGSA